VSRSPSLVVQWRTLVVTSEVGAMPRAVAHVLSTHMDRNGGSCFPSLTTIARESGLARSTVCKALNELEVAKLIQRDRGGPKRSTRYLATSPPDGLPLVRLTDSGSPPHGHEDVPKDVHTSRAASRRRGKRSGGAGGAAREDLSYLDRAGSQ
jgi:DNA-binding transcriptional MocR family regulator